MLNFMMLSVVLLMVSCYANAFHVILDPKLANAVRMIEISLLGSVWYLFPTTFSIMTFIMTLSIMTICIQTST